MKLIKWVAIGASLIGVGFISLFFYYLLPVVGGRYLLVAYAFLFIFTGQAIFARLIAHTYPVTQTPLREGYILAEDVHYFVIVFAKVVVPLFLAFSYPLEAFLLWVLLDCLDGFVLPYAKRSLTLRHQIDKSTDLLSNIPFFFYIIQLAPDLTLYFTILFGLNILRTIGFLTAGRRDLLMYLPNAFTFAYLGTVVLSIYAPSVFFIIFGNVYYLLIFTAIIFILATLYDGLYNGVFRRFRYRYQYIQKRRYEMRWR